MTSKYDDLETKKHTISMSASMIDDLNSKTTCMKDLTKVILLGS